MPRFFHTLFLLLSASFLLSGSAFAELKVQPGDRVAFLGASISQQGYSNPKGYVNLTAEGLKEAGAEIEVIPAGISGNRSNQMLERLERDVIAKKPQWMILKAAGNDVWHSAQTLDQFKANVTQILDQVSAAGIKTLIITQTPLGEDASDPRNVRLAPFNEFMRQTAKERGLLLADANADMANALSDRKPGEANRLTTDGVHLNDAGNRLMARSVLRAFGVPEFQGRVSRMGDYATNYEFEFNGRTARVVIPDVQAPGKPWLFRTIYWRAFANSEDEMIRRGWAVAFIQMENRASTPAHLELRNAFYQMLVQEHGFSPKPIVFGMSYGGLASLRWANANPDKICGIYVDAPVANFRNWSKRTASTFWPIALKEYGYSEEELLNGKGNPVNACVILAEHKIPMLLICGDSDKVVNFEENGKLLAENFQKAGGDLTFIVKPGCDHHPHGLEDPAKVVEFYEKCWKNVQK